MSKSHIIRAWKDEEYFNNLSESERSLLPANPVGIIELTDPDMAQAEGGTLTLHLGCGASLITVCSYDPAWCPITVIPTSYTIEA